MDGTGEQFSDFVNLLGSRLRPLIVSYPLDAPLGYAELEAIARSQLPSDQPFVLLAESFSGPIAVSIAASPPSGLVGLILSCSFVKNPRPMFLWLRSVVGVLPVRAVPTWLLSRMLLGRFSTPKLRQTLARVLGIVSVKTLKARIRAVLDVDASPHLTEVKVPLLYLRATEDRIVPVAASRLILRLLPTAKVLDVEAPHFMLQAVPAIAVSHVEAFVHEVAPCGL